MSPGVSAAAAGAVLYVTSDLLRQVDARRAEGSVADTDIVLGKVDDELVAAFGLALHKLRQRAALARR